MVQASPTDVIYISSLDDRVRPKRFYLAPGETSYRVEAIYEHDGWRNDKRVQMPAWRLGHAASVDEAIAPHMQHLERAFSIPAWETRTDVPDWMRNVAMVTTLHGMHYTGFMFNDYAKQLEILRWMATQIPGERVLVFSRAWDGRYYWDYPNYQRVGSHGRRGRHSSDSSSEGAEARLQDDADVRHELGEQEASRCGRRSRTASTNKIDGDVYNLNWVDWNNDRHQDGWLAYMNLGVDSWRKHLEGRIAEMIDRYGVDAYFLDIAGGHVNSTNGDMHEGTRRLVRICAAKYPKVALRRRDAVRRAARVHPDVSRRRRRGMAEVQQVLLST